MRAAASIIVFALCIAFLGALGCSRGEFTTHPIDMSGTVMSERTFVIGVNRLECADEATVGDTLRLRFWGLVGSDGCHEFSHFSTERDSHQVDITVMGSVQPLGGCPEVMVMLGGAELDVYPLYEGDLTVVVHQPGETALVETVHVAGASAGGARSD